MPAYDPTREDHFAFGLWTVGHQGRDPFGDAVRPWLDPAESVRHLSDLGVWGVSFHDDDLLAPQETWSDRRAALARFRLSGRGRLLPGFGCLRRSPRSQPLEGPIVQIAPHPLAGHRL